MEKLKTSLLKKIHFWKKVYKKKLSFFKAITVGGGLAMLFVLSTALSCDADEEVDVHSEISLNGDFIVEYFQGLSLTEDGDRMVIDTDEVYGPSKLPAFSFDVTILDPNGGYYAFFNNEDNILIDENDIPDLGKSELKTYFDNVFEFTRKSVREAEDLSPIEFDLVTGEKKYGLGSADSRGSLDYRCYAINGSAKESEDEATAKSRHAWLQCYYEGIKNMTDPDSAKEMNVGLQQVPIGIVAVGFADQATFESRVDAIQAQIDALDDSPSTADKKAIVDAIDTLLTDGDELQLDLKKTVLDDPNLFSYENIKLAPAPNPWTESGLTMPTRYTYIELEIADDGETLETSGGEIFMKTDWGMQAKKDGSGNTITPRELEEYANKHRLLLYTSVMVESEYVFDAEKRYRTDFANGNNTAVVVGFSITFDAGDGFVVPDDDGADNSFSSVIDYFTSSVNEGKDAAMYVRQYKAHPTSESAKGRTTVTYHYYVQNAMYKDWQRNYLFTTTEIPRPIGFDVYTGIEVGTAVPTSARGGKKVPGVTIPGRESKSWEVEIDINKESSDFSLPSN